MKGNAKWLALAVAIGVLVAWVTVRLTSPPEINDGSGTVARVPGATGDEPTSVEPPAGDRGAAEPVSETDATPAEEGGDRGAGAAGDETRFAPPQARPPAPPTSPDSSTQPPDRLSEGCRANLKMVCLAVVMYTVDYDEQFPIAPKWCDAVSPYMKNDELFRCPAAGLSYGYSLNGNLDRRSMRAVHSLSTTVMLFDSSAGIRNAHDPGTSLCKPPRHPDGNNFGYVDGHVVARTSPQQFTLGPR